MDSSENRIKQRGVNLDNISNNRPEAPATSSSMTWSTGPLDVQTFRSKGASWVGPHGGDAENAGLENAGQ